MATIIDYLTQAELAEYRALTAKETMAQGGHPDISLEDGVKAIVDAWEFMGAIQRRCEIDAEDSFDIRVYDGAIVKVD